MYSLVFLAAAAGSAPLESVVVTATRVETPLREVLSSVEVIPGDELLRSPASDLGDALRLRSGVEVVRLGGPGQQTSLFLRGTDSNHTLVLVDGLRINPGTTGGAAIQNIAPELVERVEIVKGPRSTLYGSDALGGVINVITRRGASHGASVQAGAVSRASRFADAYCGRTFVQSHCSSSQTIIAFDVQTPWPSSVWAILTVTVSSGEITIQALTSRVAGSSYHAAPDGVCASALDGTQKPSTKAP